MAIGPKRVKLFADAAEVSKRDTMLRLTRRPHPLEAMHSTRGQEAYGLVTVLTFSETKQGGPLPIRATYGPDGRYCMSQSLERRISSAERPNPRDYLTVPELATLLDVSETTITRGMSKAGLEMYRPGGAYGRRRIKRSVVEAFITRCNFDEIHREAYMRQIEAIIRGQSEA